VPLFVLLAAAAAGAQPAPPPPPLPANDREREQFLLEAEVVETRPAPSGVTGSLRATLRQGGLSHDANIQTIDEARAHKNVGSRSEIDFRDSYKNNVAAYRLDRLLGLGMVPVTVVRPHENEPGAFTWWVDDLLMTEKERRAGKHQAPDVDAWNAQVRVVRVFDQLIFNFDRNLGNLVIDKGWRLWMIDHSRAFKIVGDLRHEKDLGGRCEKRLLAALRALDQESLQREMKDLLNEGQVQGLLARRDRIVGHFDKLIAKHGEAAVLYELSPRRAAAP
jgi:hypothetical protein